MKRFLPLLLAVYWLTTSDARAADWVHWRGPEQNGVSREKDLPERWSPDPKDPDNNLIWKMPYGARSTPLVMNGRIYLINDADEGVREQERVMCFDADTGRVLWEKRFNVFLTDIVSVRVGWTNLAGDPETGNIYAHGTQGFLICFDKDGKILWSHSLTEEYGRISGYGGRLTTPTVDGDLVIIGMLNSSWGDQARGGNRFLALDKRTGTPVWWSNPAGQPKDTYSSVPVVAVINGERLLITGGGDGAVHALKVRTGEKVWSSTISAGGINCSPVVEGTRVYIGHGEENLDSPTQGRVVCLDAGQVKDGKPARVWEKKGIKAKFAAPLLHEGRLYICDDSARMYCLDAATGKQLWRYNYGRNGKASPVWADGKIYVGDVNAKFHILKPGSKSCETLHAQFFPSPDGVADVEINGSPAVANGRVYFTTNYETYCIGKKDHKAPADPIPPQPREDPADTSAKPAHLQVVPADVVLKPGDSSEFKVWAFDNQGRFLREIEASWSLPAGAPPPGAKEGPPPLKGEISSAAKLAVDKMVPGQFGLVRAEAGGLSSLARVRVAPQLPYQQNFERVPEGRTPAGWVNCQGKFTVVTKDGAKVLKKLANNASPLLARANAYIGMPSLTDYTIQADVQGAQKGPDLPDMGLVANRYHLILDGNKQRLRLASWDAVPRIEKAVDWKWKPGAWYRLKLTVNVQGDKALVRGKVWQRDEQEPADWTVALDDPTPNREGSPALYGYALGILENEPGTEIFYGNVSVRPNQKKVGTASQK